MSSVQLLDKTRKIGKLLHNNNSSKVVFNDICKVMRDIVNSNVLVISKKGKVLGVGTCEGVEELKELVEDNVGGFIDPMLPDVTSQNLEINLATVDLPPPLGPTNAVKLPAGIVRSIPCNTSSFSSPV